jgi:hypothetical protein|tara:strand:+ start:119 stop:385 length:267 start_codon:yes stop_codon:yes gene_type:complete
LNTYIKGFLSGVFLCLSIVVLFGATNSPHSVEQTKLIQKLDNIEQKIDFNYNVLNKHLVRIMAYGVKVKEGQIDGVRRPVDCKHTSDK